MPNLHWKLTHHDYRLRWVRHDWQAIHDAEQHRQARQMAFTLWQAVQQDAPQFVIECLSDNYWRAWRQAPGCMYQQGFESMLTALLKHGRDDQGQRSKFAHAFIVEMKRRADAADAAAAAESK